MAEIGEDQPVLSDPAFRLNAAAWTGMAHSFPTA